MASCPASVWGRSELHVPRWADESAPSKAGGIESTPVFAVQLVPIPTLANQERFVVCLAELRVAVDPQYIAPSRELTDLEVLAARSSGQWATAQVCRLGHDGVGHRDRPQRAR